MGVMLCKGLCSVGILGMIGDFSLGGWRFFDCVEFVISC